MLRTGARIAGRSAAAVAVVVAVVTVLVAPATGAAPVDRLQLVDVEIGADGSVNGLRVVDLTQNADGGGSERNERLLDPSERADDLPVAVRTSFVAHDRVGTDLRQLEGEKGQVEVAITVVNQTGTIEQMGITTEDGTTRLVDVLVATPLTVVLTARLPGNAGTEIRSETNGTVSQQSGKTYVQWGAVLAPPALSGSATFRLAMDTSKFRIEEMVLTVEPGVAPDFSVRRIRDLVFGEVPQAEDGRLIDVHAEIAKTLDLLGGQLEEIRDSVTEASTKRGDELTSALQTTTDALEGQITGLQSSAASTMRLFAADARRQLDTSKQQIHRSLLDVIELIGFRVTSDGLGEILLPDGDEPATVLQVVRLVQRQLHDADSLDPAPLDLVTTLNGLIGIPGGPCPAGDTSLQCQIEALSAAQLDAQTSAIQALVDDVPTLLEPVTTALGDADSELDLVANSLISLDDYLGQAESALDTAEDDLGGSTSVKSALTAADAAIDATRAHLQAAQQAAADAETALTAADGLGAYLQTIDGADGITSLVEAIASATTARSTLTTAISTLATDMCNQLPADVHGALNDSSLLQPGTTSGDVASALAGLVDALSQRIEDATCSGPGAPFPGDLLELANAVDIAGIETARAAASAKYDTVLTSVEATITAIDEALLDLDTADTQVENALAGVGSSGTGGALKLVRDASDAVDSATAELTGTTQPDATSAQIDLDAASSGLTTLSTDVINGLNQLGTDLATLVDDATADFQDGASAALDAAVLAVTEAAAALGADTEPALREAAGAAADLDEATDTDLTTLGASIVRETDQLTARFHDTLEATRAELLRSTAQVFNTLGLFQGDLAHHTNDMAKTRSDIGGVEHRSSAFRGVREAVAFGRRVRAAQQEAANDRLRGGLLFDGDAPGGSTVGTAFVFTFESIG